MIVDTPLILILCFNTNVPTQILRKDLALPIWGPINSSCSQTPRNNNSNQASAPNQQHGSIWYVVYVALMTNNEIFPCTLQIVSAGVETFSTLLARF